MGGPARVREPLGASRGLRTNRRPAGFRKPMGAQQEAEGQKDPRRYQRARMSADVKRPMAVPAGTGGLMRGLSRCWRATGAQQSPEGPREAPAGVSGQGRESFKRIFLFGSSFLVWIPALSSLTPPVF